jgi:hypothetical protein
MPLVTELRDFADWADRLVSGGEDTALAPERVRRLAECLDQPQGCADCAQLERLLKALETVAAHLEVLRSRLSIDLLQLNRLRSLAAAYRQTE